MKGTSENQPRVILLQGGLSGEREVSLRSGKAVVKALQGLYPVEVRTVEKNEFPGSVDPEREVVFSVLHGGFGEDGGMQRLLEEKRWPFVGSGSAASALCMNKRASKEVVTLEGVPVAAEMELVSGGWPRWEEVSARLGSPVVVKPNAGGSSLGLHFPEDAEGWAGATAEMDPEEMILEEWIPGRELSVGILEDRALEVVEICPRSGRYDYQSKYTAGETEYRAPAPLPEEVRAQVGSYALRAFRALGCRDYARADFRLSPEGKIVFLEINTLPGLTPLSLLPQSAEAAGISFSELLSGLVHRAWLREASSET